MDERVITFRPKTANCTEYTEDDKSATLTLGYHYGMGGDAALICYRVVSKGNREAFLMPEHQFETCSMSHDLFSTKFGKDGKADTLARTDYKEPPVVCWVNSSGNGISAPLDASYFKGQGIRQGIEREYIVIEKQHKNEWYCCGNSQSVTIGLFPVSNTLDCMHDTKFILGRCNDLENKISLYDGSQTAPTLTRKNADYDQRMPDKKNFNAVIERECNNRKYILRRLTPMECSRLQGFPDWWTDGTDGSDSAIYKMWGNGIALPCAADVIGRIAKEMGRDSDDIALER